MSLGLLSKKQILNTWVYKYPRVCIDNKIWEILPQFKSNPVNKWEEIKFTKANVKHFDINKLHRQQGIYMFIAKPHTQHIRHHSYVLYIGETTNLRKRYMQYFKYIDTTEPSDQLKRRMVILWQDYLYFTYIKTSFRSTKDREVQEYYLIDTIFPPINDKFRAEAAKLMKKNLRDV